jgi:hypothetical protein
MTDAVCILDERWAKAKGQNFYVAGRANYYKIVKTVNVVRSFTIGNIRVMLLGLLNQQ